MTDLLPDEIKYLGKLRCKSCGHLESLHNDHCCTFCMVDDCLCEWGEIPECNLPECTNKIVNLTSHATGTGLVFANPTESDIKRHGPFYVVGKYCSGECAAKHQPDRYKFIAVSDGED